MVVENQQRNHQLGNLGFDHMSYTTASPHFTNPWSGAASSSISGQIFPVPSIIDFNSIAKQQAARANSVSMPYATIPVTAPPMGMGRNLPSSYGSQDLLSISQDILSSGRLAGGQYVSEHNFSTATSPAAANAYAPTSVPSYDNMGYGTAQSRSPYAMQQQQPQQQQQQQQQLSAERRLSQPSVPSNSFLGSPVEAQRQRQNSLVDLNRGLSLSQGRENFIDTLDAGRGMVAMSQDTTPRNIHAPRSRGSTDSYGFPATHSSSSSVSSTSTYPYFGSMDSSVTEYSSTTSEALDTLPSRTLPRPSGLVGGSIPPAPQSMMGQFSSKVSSTAQKKHKCKVCDKRFTRPSSLQTHMYSHTGEKRKFPSNFTFCGVLSALR
ncbi:MAG: hypothetical protein M1813_001087 [Trichoglossum hirsutum]|nr:MAG: hypothetical protein M1813_001087 [Trichoglossum hirsutum]